VSLTSPQVRFLFDSNTEHREMLAASRIFCALNA
jgi:hypothetical protein